MHEYMQGQFIDPGCQGPITQRFEITGMFAPITAECGEGFCLHNIFSIDMRSADGIKHIVGFIVGGTIQPEFSHRHIGILIMH